MDTYTTPDEQIIQGKQHTETYCGYRLDEGMYWYVTGCHTVIYEFSFQSNYRFCPCCGNKIKTIKLDK